MSFLKVIATKDLPRRSRNQKKNGYHHEAHEEHEGRKYFFRFDVFSVILFRALRITIVESFRSLRKFSGGPWLSKTGICSRPDAKSGSLISLRPLRVCARYSEFWLRLGRASFFVVKNWFVDGYLCCAATRLSAAPGAVLQRFGIDDTGQFAVHVIEDVCYGILRKPSESGIRRPAQVRGENHVVELQ